MIYVTTNFLRDNERRLRDFRDDTATRSACRERSFDPSVARSLAAPWFAASVQVLHQYYYFIISVYTVLI